MCFKKDEKETEPRHTIWGRCIPRKEDDVIKTSDTFSLFRCVQKEHNVI